MAGTSPAMMKHWRCSRRSSGPRIPFQNLFAGPEQHTVMTAGVVIDRFKIFDAMRLATDIGVDRKGEDFDALFALGVEPVELVDRALQKIVALMMLHDHHRDVVELDR